jgi:hypothetical protein
MPLVHPLALSSPRLTRSLSAEIKVHVAQDWCNPMRPSRLSLKAMEVQATSELRHMIEEMIKALRDPLSLAGCQAGSTRPHARQTEVREGAHGHHAALGSARFWSERALTEGSSPVATQAETRHKAPEGFIAHPQASENSCATSVKGEHAREPRWWR